MLCMYTSYEHKVNGAYIIILIIPNIIATLYRLFWCENDWNHAMKNNLRYSTHCSEMRSIFLYNLNGWGSDVYKHDIFKTPFESNFCTGTCSRWYAYENKISNIIRNSLFSIFVYSLANFLLIVGFLSNKKGYWNVRLHSQCHPNLFKKGSRVANI